MARAREAGITFAAIRDIMSAHDDDGPDGESFGRMVERIRAAGVQVRSSDTLVQVTKAIWGDAGRTSHHIAVHQRQLPHPGAR
jgi:hypothetical protein